jgi:hypothetical protein
MNYPSVFLLRGCFGLQDSYDFSDLSLGKKERLARDTSLKRYVEEIAGFDRIVGTRRTISFHP